MRVALAIPAYNEEATIADVASRAMDCLPQVDLFVVDDGSDDGTREILEGLGVRTLRHLCNLGYGEAMHTAIEFARRQGYDALVSLDADGQHDPRQVTTMLLAFSDSPVDLLVGSRYVARRRYGGTPLPRRIGMTAFSLAVRAATGHRVYDTTSGLKVIRSSAFEPLTRWRFVDFHAEALVYLLRLGYSVAEHPIVVEPRRYGRSMYSLTSAFDYPLKTTMMLALGIVEAALTRRRTHS